MKTNITRFYLPVLVAALALGACTNAGENSGSGAAVPVPATDVPSRPGPDTAKPAETSRDAITGICEISRGDPGAVVTLPDLNATDDAKKALREEVSDYVADLDTSSEYYDVLNKFVGDEETKAEDACAALEGIERGPEKPETADGGLIAAINSVGPGTARANFNLIEAACEGDQKCIDELNAWKEWLQANCTSDRCDDQVVAYILLFGRQPSNAQEQAKICPSTGCPQIEEIIKSVEEFQSDPSVDSTGDEPAPDKGVVEPERTEEILDVLNSAPGKTELTQDELRELIAAECPECEKILDDLIARLVRLSEEGTVTDPGVKQTVDDLASRTPVLPADLAVAIAFLRDHS